MKKTVIILSILALIAGSCGQGNTQNQVASNSDFQAEEIAVNQDSYVPLINAIETNDKNAFDDLIEHIKLVQLLIDNNCKIDVIDKQGETPFTIAERNNNQKMTDLLRENSLIEKR